MYQVSENQVEWYILNKNSNLLYPYINTGVKTLSLGAGMWVVNEINGKKVLINKIYVDDEVNMPDIFLQKIKRKHVVNIFNNMLDYIKIEGDK